MSIFLIFYFTATSSHQKMNKDMAPGSEQRHHLLVLKKTPTNFRSSSIAFFFF